MISFSFDMISDFKSKIYIYFFASAYLKDFIYSVSLELFYLSSLIYCFRLKISLLSVWILFWFVEIIWSFSSSCWFKSYIFLFFSWISRSFSIFYYFQLLRASCTDSWTFESLSFRSLFSWICWLSLSSYYLCLLCPPFSFYSIFLLHYLSSFERLSMILFLSIMILLLSHISLFLSHISFDFSSKSRCNWYILLSD